MAGMMVGILLGIASLVINLVAYERTVDPSMSMTPTIAPGATLQVRRVPGDQVRRGDVIVFSTAAWEGDDEVVGRVVALGGDTVQCCESQRRIVVNEHAVTEDYVATGEGRHRNRKYRVGVLPGHVWVLGDNRGKATDSRDEIGGATGGGVPLGDIRGVVVKAAGHRVATRAFVRAGLPGEPFEDELDHWVYVILVSGGVLFVGGIVWLLVVIRKRGV
nr:Signal peptidase I [Kibdelosporangium sp. MJ126-NF4]CTQ92186.1 Signal peptidase I (EC 3.4.21.89) [Kibdelosporangium sp. MJ126-NF4]